MTDWTAIDFEHHITLIEDTYELYWNNLEDDQIEFGIECATTGWCAIGISSAGDMINSDIMIMWVDDSNNAILQNRNTLTDPTMSKPELNSDQSYVSLISGQESNGSSRFRFIRDKYPCNDSQNINLPKGTTRLIFSFNVEDPADEEWSDGGYYHTQRGTKSINLELGPGFDTPLPSQYSTVNLTVSNFTIPTDTDTVYYCQVYKLPETAEKQHIVRYEPIYTIGNEVHLHHILLWHCPPSASAFIDHGEICPNSPGASNMPIIDGCRDGRLVSGWAVGADAFDFPENVGFPMSGTEDSSQDDILQYILMEVHYDIPPDSNPVPDSSGIRIYYTSELREYDAGLLETGIKVHPNAQFIPQGIETATNYGYCPSQCTQNHLPSDGVNVFSVFLHAHTAATGLVLRHIRNGQELKPIAENMSYDFNYQQAIPQYNETKILPGDELSLQCQYSTIDRATVTVAGEGTADEMCLAFVYVFPKPEFAICESSHQLSDFIGFFWQATFLGYVTGDLTTALETEDTDAISWNNNDDAALALYNDYWTSNGGSVYDIYCGQSFDVSSEPVDISHLFVGNFIGYQQEDVCLSASPTTSDPLSTSTATPTIAPTLTLTTAPTLIPTRSPTPIPTAVSTSIPTSTPTGQPISTMTPISTPTASPMPLSTVAPTSRFNTSEPTASPISAVNNTECFVAIWVSIILWIFNLYY
eukprot:212028_1